MGTPADKEEERPTTPPEPKKDLTEGGTIPEPKQENREQELEELIRKVNKRR